MADKLLKLVKRIDKKADGFDDGDVIRWQRVYSEGPDHSYTFAALRAGGKWYVTGATMKRNGISFDELIDLLSSDGVIAYSVASGWQTQKV